MKTTLITTILNEGENIEAFLTSIMKQTQMPDEVIIVDGGSTDKTLALIQDLRFRIQEKSVGLKIFQKKGNRSVGRNEAIKRAKGDIILISDAGCLLDKKWVEIISKPFVKKTTQVVAGYYKGKPYTPFQEALIPYVLVMSDKVNPKFFLPATRSMALRKSVWTKLGGFNIKYSHNEDYVFAKLLQKRKISIVFQKSAIVYWIPPSSIKRAYRMFYRFALGDAEAGIFRPKAILVVIRSITFLTLLLTSLLSKNMLSVISYLLLLVFYLSWAIMKNKKYVSPKAYLYLAVLQVISDIAVTIGTIKGIIYRFSFDK